MKYFSGVGFLRGFLAVVCAGPIPESFRLVDEEGAPVGYEINLGTEGPNV